VTPSRAGRSGFPASSAGSAALPTNSVSPFGSASVPAMVSSNSGFTVPARSGGFSPHGSSPPTVAAHTGRPRRSIWPTSVSRLPARASAHAEPSPTVTGSRVPYASFDVLPENAITPSRLSAIGPGTSLCVPPARSAQASAPSFSSAATKMSGPPAGVAVHLCAPAPSSSTPKIVPAITMRSLSAASSVSDAMPKRSFPAEYVPTVHAARGVPSSP
jgi:hypothetical protein